MYNKYGDVIGYTSLIFDITNEINLNDESSILQAQIKKAQEELLEKNNLLVQQSKLSIMTETLKRLSHEWRQPLNLISLQAQKLEIDYTLNEELDPKETISSLEKIKDEASNLSKTIEDFQHFLRKEAKEELVNPKEIIDNAVNIALKDKNNFITVKIEYDKDFSFYTLKNEIILVLVNVIENAKEQLIKEEIEKGSISIIQYHNEDKIIFEIKDNARGIDENILHKIFEPYFSTKEKKHGVGLGLYTSKLIINIQLQGVITAFNNSKGATIKISIPKKKEIKMIIIPARLNSSRFENKILADILGLPMVIRTAKQVESLDDVIIATDSKKVVELAKEYGFKAVMTSSEHQSGTDRINEASIF